MDGDLTDFSLRQFRFTVIQADDFDFYVWKGHADGARLVYAEQRITVRSRGGFRESVPFEDFAARYVDGRDPYPFDRILPLAGMRAALDTLWEPRLGLQTSGDSNDIIVTGVVPGGSAQEAGVQVGDRVIALGDFSLSDPDFGPAFRARFGKQDGAPLPIKVHRGRETLTLNGKVRLVARVEGRFEIDPSASAKAVRIRSGIWKGVVGR